MPSFIKGEIMEQLFKMFLVLATCFTLTGCESFKVITEALDRPTLGITQPAPLDLRPVEWRVFNYENTPYYALDSKNYENLSKNTEDIQNRLFLDEEIIKKQESFYENKFPLDK